MRVLISVLTALLAPLAAPVGRWLARKADDALNPAPPFHPYPREPLDPDPPWMKPKATVEKERPPPPESKP